MDWCEGRELGHACRDEMENIWIRCEIEGWCEGEGKKAMLALTKCTICGVSV